MFPIYIPSKGRHDLPITAALLRAEGIPFHVVVDPCERNLYSKTFSAAEILAVQFNGRGLPAARTWIKRHSQSSGERWHWQLEDDISQFYYRPASKGLAKISAQDCLSQIERRVAVYKNIAAASPDHNSWPPKPEVPIKVNRCCHHAVLINNENKIAWRQFLFEDLDYSLQALRAGFCTLLFCHLRFASVAPRKHGGGQTPRYGDNDKLFLHMGKIAKEWPPITATRLPDGRPQLRLNQIWSTFNQRPIPVVEEPSI